MIKLNLRLSDVELSISDFIGNGSIVFLTLLPLFLLRTAYCTESLCKIFFSIGIDKIFFPSFQEFLVCLFCLGQRDIWPKMMCVLFYLKRIASKMKFILALTPVRSECNFEINKLAK